MPEPLYPTGTINLGGFVLLGRDVHHPGIKQHQEVADILPHGHQGDRYQGTDRLS